MLLTLQCYLKSSLDRFIGRIQLIQCLGILDLKSSLDRFIASPAQMLLTLQCYLKSSLDRFIVTDISDLQVGNAFKIQFG